MLGSLVLVWVFIFFLFLFVRTQRPKNFPLGPRPVPMFGKLDITNHLKGFEKLAERYGNVYSQYIGGTPAVVLAGLKAVKEALVIKAADFFRMLTKPPSQPSNSKERYQMMLSVQQRGNDGSSFREQQLVACILDLRGAGTDTTSNTLLTAFLYLITHPDIQERCQKEIDEVLEGKAHASFEDRYKMPHTQAVIHECQRITNTIPLSVFHCTSRDTELMGYRIRKDTVIIPNLASVLSEEGQWKFPHEFNPANFLNEQGQFKKPEAFLPFSTRLCVCLGEGLAHMELFLILDTLLRRFQFFWPKDAGEPDFTLVHGLTVTPKPYRMGVRLRQPDRL